MYEFKFDEFPIVLKNDLLGGKEVWLQIDSASYSSYGTDYGDYIAMVTAEIILEGQYIKKNFEGDDTLATIYYDIYFYDDQDRMVSKSSGYFDYSLGTVKSKIPIYDSSLPIGIGDCLHK